MKIAYLAAGAGGMYCGACHRDMALVRQLIARGHDVEILPLYTPLRADDDIPPTTRVFYGGVSCYLAQTGRIGTMVARVLDGLLSSNFALNLASKQALSTDPTELGALTVSVLSGKDGRQADALKQLLAHFRKQPPEIVCLSNSLLSGIAPEVKAQLGVPIVCSLQGEETFVDALRAPYADQARQRMRENARAIDRFLATGESVAAAMAEYLAVAPSRISVVRPGLDPERYPAATARPRDPFVIGYLSAIAPRKGLKVLVEAWHALTRERKRNAVLRVAGQVLDRRYWDDVQALARTNGGEGRFEYVGELSREEKLGFLHSSSCFVLPSMTAEVRGLAAMEAMASGVPVILPDSGVFPELLVLTKGGVLTKPEDAAGLADALARLMDEPDQADELGRNAAAGIRKHYTAGAMADRVEQILCELLNTV